MYGLSRHVNTAMFQGCEYNYVPSSGFKSQAAAAFRTSRIDSGRGCSSGKTWVSRDLPNSETHSGKGRTSRLFQRSNPKRHPGSSVRCYHLCDLWICNGCIVRWLAWSEDDTLTKYVRCRLSAMRARCKLYHVTIHPTDMHKHSI